MLRRVHSLVFLLAAVVVPISVAQESPAVAPPGGPTAGDPQVGPEAAADPDAAPETLPRIPDEILGKLGDEKYKERLAAQSRLLSWGRKDLKGSIETLYALYQEADDPEVRLRIRMVLKQLVIIHQPFEGEGYLGVQMKSDLWKNAQGQVQPAVRITEVREGTAAEVAKLQADDLVVGVDDLVFDDLSPIEMFAEHIRGKGPGDEITLHIKRGDEDLKLTAFLRRRSPILNQATPWGVLPILPEQSELDEGDFQDWLKMRALADRAREQG